MMADNLRAVCDGILQRVVTDKPRVPGVVAIITSRSNPAVVGEESVHFIKCISHGRRSENGERLLLCPMRLHYQRRNRHRKSSQNTPSRKHDSPPTNACFESGVA